jgi:hypothetical protein
MTCSHSRAAERGVIREERHHEQNCHRDRLTLATTSAYADSCKATSAEKKLAGAAQTSFMKKCESDAQKARDTQAAEKKLNGVAKTSFTKRHRRGRHLTSAPRRWRSPLTHGETVAAG